MRGLHDRVIIQNFLDARKRRPRRAALSGSCRSLFLRQAGLERSQPLARLDLVAALQAGALDGGHGPNQDVLVDVAHVSEPEALAGETGQAPRGVDALLPQLRAEGRVLQPRALGIEEDLSEYVLRKLVVA